MSRDWLDGVNNETSKSFQQRYDSGFFTKYMSGVVLDVGYQRSASKQSKPVLPNAIGVDLDYPGYNGVTLPFADDSVDAVYSSHVLEHIDATTMVIRDWHRVLKIGGHIVCIVPHQFLYEKKMRPPSLWNGEHRRFYTPTTLLAEFEQALVPNSYRVRHLCDNDDGYDYAIGPDRHAAGAYEIECVIEKIEQPTWSLQY